MVLQMPIEYEDMTFELMCDKCRKILVTGNWAACILASHDHHDGLDEQGKKTHQLLLVPVVL